MSGSNEFVIDQQKKDIVVESQAKIERLFSVKVTLTNGGSADGMLWVILKGKQDTCERAKDYIKALTSPEQRNVVSIPASLVSRLGLDTQEHRQLETEYGVVVRYPKKTEAVIEGNDVQVTLASSKLEDLKDNFTKTAKDNKALEEFALKLGYEQAAVSAVFEKLGPNVDKNTFLNELINTSNQISRVGEERRTPIPMHNMLPPGSTSSYTRDAYARHPHEMVVSKGMSTGNHFTGVGGGSAMRFLRPDGSGVVPRGCVGSSAKTLQGNVPSTYTREYGNVNQSNGGLFTTVTNDVNQNGPDHRQEEQMFQELLTNGCRYQQFPTSDLRHIVIDGSNVAMSHGNNKVFSCKGIALCVDFFLKRGHMQITVFVPQWRKESAKPESPITDQHLLNKLEEQGYLTFTPSRRINGRRIVCYDDRFVVRLADKTDGIIVSNDNFKDLSQENPKWKEVIERRLLMYSFVTDMFMPPDDPLGRHGPTLDEFLHKGTPTHRRLCPYGRRCTYGNRCKFHHPEREDKRLQVYQTLKDMFPSQDALILNVMKQYPHEKDPGRLASLILDMPQTN